VRSGNHGGSVQLADGLFDGAGGQAEPDGGAVRLLHEGEGVAQQHREFVHVGGFEGGQAVGGHADQGVLTDWCWPPSGANVIPEGVETKINRAS